MSDQQLSTTDQSQVTRRNFLTSAVMAGGLITGYGILGGMAGRFLYPGGRTPMQWAFVAEVDNIKKGESFCYRTPWGNQVAIARLQDSGKESDFIALSTECPHLGCQVHWQPQHNHFFCPCHNGTFDASGKATGGPPADAGQSLPGYSLKVEEGLLYIEIPIESVACDPLQREKYL